MKKVFNLFFIKKVIISTINMSDQVVPGGEWDETVLGPLEVQESQVQHAQQEFVDEVLLNLEEMLKNSHYIDKSFFKI
jgi:hypothetical protein